MYREFIKLRLRSRYGEFSVQTSTVRSYGQILISHQVVKEVTFQELMYCERGCKNLNNLIEKYLMTILMEDDQKVSY